MSSSASPPGGCLETPAHRGSVTDPARLDPQARALLDLMSSAVRPDLSTLPVLSVRTMFDETLKAFAGKSDSVVDVRDMTVESPGRSIGVRSYTPATQRDSVCPGLIYFHGGAFVSGSLDTHDVLCRLLASESSCRVLSVEYCLAPEHVFPQAVDEALAVSRWIHAQSQRVGVDSRRLAVGGDSAGGTLAAVVCQQARQDETLEVHRQLLVYPMTSFLADTASRRALSRDYFLEEQILRAFGSLYLGPAGDPRDSRVSPLLARDFHGLPDAILVTAGYDPLCDEGLEYASKLESAGVGVTRIHYEQMCHGFLNATGVLESAHAALREIAASLHAEMFMS